MLHFVSDVHSLYHIELLEPGTSFDCLDYGYHQTVRYYKYQIIRLSQNCMFDRKENGRASIFAFASREAVNFAMSSGVKILLVATFLKSYSS